LQLHFFLICSHPALHSRLLIKEVLWATSFRQVSNNIIVHLGSHWARKDLFIEIKLATLDQNNVGLVVESMLGGKVYPEFFEKLARESLCNPIF